MLDKNTEARLILFHQKLNLASLSQFFERNLEQLNWYFSQLTNKSQRIQKNSADVARELNNLRKLLVLINKEWEEWKAQLILFKNYEGILRKAIRKNTQNSKQELCEIKSEEKVFN